MKKISWNELPDYYYVADLIHEINGKNLKCVGVHLCERISEEKKEEMLKKFSNIEFTTEYYRYAPELIDDVVIVYSKTRKALGI